MSLIIAIHVIVCILLIGIILIQAGRGGGLVEGFSSVESMFGTKTNTFLTRTTTVLSTLFLVTCLSLAFFSAKQSRSLMQGIVTQEQREQPSLKPTPVTEKTAGESQLAPTQAVQENIPKQEAAQQGVTETVTQEAPKSE
ncbi:MAG: preprotein translocase subunit SecG [Candidatus Omnitrophica bacterium]|nr:preprotein translocase subunit SecG [Candidatus Omnitrophota bacterium]